MACDIRIASVKAKFGQPEVGLGITRDSPVRNGYRVSWDWVRQKSCLYGRRDCRRGGLSYRVGEQGGGTGSTDG